MNAWLWSWAMLSVSGLVETTPAAKGPTVAVFELKASAGVPPATALLISTHFVEEVRKANVFSRVVGGREMETLMSFEKQKELLACENSSCMAELAGALGVDYLIVGTLGKLGTSYLFGCRLMNLAQGRVVASLAQRIKGESEELLLYAVKPVIDELLQSAGLMKSDGTKAEGPAPVVEKAAEAAPVAPASVAKTESPSEKTPQESEKSGFSFKPLFAIIPVSLVGMAVGLIGIAAWWASILGSAAIKIALNSLVLPRGFAGAFGALQIAYLALGVVGVVLWSIGAVVLISGSLVLLGGVLLP